MTFRVFTSDNFDRSFSKLDNSTQKKIKKWIDNHLTGCTNPRGQGKPLKGSLSGLWRYRVGAYRLLANIQDDKIIILLVDVGHRKEIYS